MYYNDGPMDPSQAAGSSFGWTPQAEPAYAGLVAGTCEYFADLNGDGFPDEHYLSEGTFNNKARTSLAPGCGQKDHTGDDSDMTSDLPLPTVPNSTSGGGGTTGSGLPSTGTGCVSGTGSGDYSGLCTYVCARGFCPSPCTCTTTGTYVSIPRVIPSSSNLGMKDTCKYAGYKEPSLFTRYVECEKTKFALQTCWAVSAASPTPLPFPQYPPFSLSHE